MQEIGPLKDFAVLVREFRKGQGWTQSQMSEAWAYSFETISAWERRKRKPGRSELPRLAQLLGVEVEQLVVLVHQDSRTRPSRSRRLGEQVLETRSQASSPFADGQLLWSLHLGLGADGLQCVISRPVGAGKDYEIALDPVSDFNDIQAVYQLVSAQVGLKARERQVPSLSNVVALSQVV